ncbi:MAG: cupredoxin domain-containing protein [Alphaproteobacteria bacterium]
MKKTKCALLALALAGMTAFLVAPSIAYSENIPAAPEKQQTITISAKNGYEPETSTAKANERLKLRVVTEATFDCSTTLVIPSLGYKARLPSTGLTEIDVPPQKPGTELTGLCGMGMYSFTVKFVE